MTPGVLKGLCSLQLDRAFIWDRTENDYNLFPIMSNVLRAGTKIVVVDDVLTSGKSTLQACERFEEENYSIVGVIGLVDREREAPEREILHKKYKHVNALFSWREFPRLEQYLSGENTKAAASR
jgi:orotate phosphoribosyltransferase